MDEAANVELAVTLLGYEVALARRDFRALPGGLASVLDEHFVEIGASGRRWTREATISALVAESPTPGVSIEDFEVDEVLPGVVIARFASLHPGGRRVVRSSVWVRRNDAWRLRFHQGTVATERGPA